MEYRSRLPGEPSLDHPGVPTGRLGHRAGLKTVGGIFRRFFCGLPALPAGCSDPGVGARSTGKHRSPQTAPRLRGPNIGAIEPSRFPDIVGDAFRASLTWSVELSGGVNPFPAPGNRPYGRKWNIAPVCPVSLLTVTYFNGGIRALTHRSTAHMRSGTTNRQPPL